MRNVPTVARARAPVRRLAVLESVGREDDDDEVVERGGEDEER
jgi:hypothetical protein